MIPQIFPQKLQTKNTEENFSVSLRFASEIVEDFFGRQSSQHGFKLFSQISFKM